MSKTRLWVFGIVAAMLVVAIGGWTLGISPVLAQITSADAQLTSSQASSQSSQSQLAALKVQYKGIAKLKKKLDVLRLSVPETQAASLFIDEITLVSASTGVTVKSISIASATLYTAPATTGTTAATTTSGDAGATATPSAAATATPVTAPESTTSSGLVLIPVVITVSGSLEATRLFADGMQTGPRLLVASGLSVAIDGAVASTTVTGDIFSQQGTSDPPVKSKPVAPVVPVTPTATPTATPTSTPTPAATTTSSGSKSGTKPAPTTAPTTAPAADPTPSPTATP